MPRQPRIEPSRDVVARVAATASALPEAYEEDAWTGVRWRIRNKTFAHVLVAQEGYTSAYRDLTGVTEPTTVLTFRSSGDELMVLIQSGPPFYQPPWSPTVVGMVLDDHTDWDEVAELVTESYRFCAPKKLSDRLALPRMALPSTVRGDSRPGRRRQRAAGPATPPRRTRC